ncbi:MAG: DUF6323 family protein [Methanomassiliicoccales archaeon]
MPNIIRLTYQLYPGMSKQEAINELVSTNMKSQYYGLALSEADTRQIIVTREEVLKNLGRVELGMEVTSKLITAFCESPYISQLEYASTICELIEIFYYMKNETQDKIGDEELIQIMKEYFDDRCFGSLQLLLDRECVKLIEKVRIEGYQSNIRDEDEV